MIALLRQVADAGSGEGARWAGMRTDRIMSEMLADLGSSSKLNAEWDFLSMLRDEGRRCATAFLEEHTSNIGYRRPPIPPRAAGGVLSDGLSVRY